MTLLICVQWGVVLYLSYVVSMVTVMIALVYEVGNQSEMFNALPLCTVYMYVSVALVGHTIC